MRNYYYFFKFFDFFFFFFLTDKQKLYKKKLGINYVSCKFHTFNINSKKSQYYTLLSSMSRKFKYSGFFLMWTRRDLTNLPIVGEYINRYNLIVIIHWN